MVAGPDGATSPFTIRLFGPLEVCLNGGPLPRLRFRKSQWLLALLALRHGAAVEREWLIGLLWPESSGSQPLRNCLTDLRRALGDQSYRLRSPAPDTLTLDLAGACVDLVAFDAALARDDAAALEEAVSLYRGPLLEGCCEEWAFQERELREQAYLTSRERLAALAIERGDATEAERHLRLAVGTDPLRESTQRTLMQVLAAGGNYAAALLCYRELRLHLHRELNAEPDPETQTLFQQLRSEARRLSAKASPVGVHHPGPGANSGTSAPNRNLGAASELPAITESLRTVDPRRHNLPVQRTPLIGREKEVAQALQLLGRDETGLLTLTGPGGSGKTRLGLQVAADLLSDFEHGVFFVGLAPIREPGLVPSAIAQALGVAEVVGMPLVESLTVYLKSRHILLLLDNFEQVLAAAPVVAGLLAAAPRLKVLVTSRAALRLRSEKEFPVPPLAVPGVQELRCSGVYGVPRPGPEHLNTRTPEYLTQYAAVRLFIQRALDVRAGFTLTSENAPAVAAICQRLDGLPLAIELAAARLKVLSPQALLARLERRLPLLTGGPRDAPARQQTLRDTITWSYDLLDEPAKRLFRRLSVFVGGCTLEAANAVCADFEPQMNTDGHGWPTSCGEGPPASSPHLRASGSICGSPIQNPDVLEVLSSLVDNSLLQQEPGAAGEPRFRMLETVREYGIEQLTESGELDALRRRHAHSFLVFAEETMGTDQQEWLDRVERDLDNLRAALAWTVETRTTEWGLRLGGALREFWHVRGYWSEGRDRLAELLALPGAEARTMGRLKALEASGVLALGHRHAAALPFFEESLAIARELGSRPNVAYSLMYLAEFSKREGVWEEREGAWEKARALLEESLAIRRELGDQGEIARVLLELGDVLLSQGEPGARRTRSEERTADEAEKLATEAGRARLEESLKICRELGNQRGIAQALFRLARARHVQGDLPAARPLYEQSLAIFRKLGALPDIGESLEYLGHLAQQEGEREQAAALFEESLVIRREIGDREHTYWLLHILVDAALEQGDRERARALLQEEEAAARAIDEPRGRMHPLGGVGHDARDLGELERAAALYRESMALRWEVGTTFDVVQGLEDAAVLAARRGQAARAARLLGAAEAQCEAIGHSPPVAQPVEYPDLLAAARVTLGEEVFAAAWAGGRAMSLKNAVEYALEEKVVTRSEQRSGGSFNP